MLANGIKFKYKKTSSATYTVLNSLKKVPDIGIEPEKVENTPLGASNKQYELGIGDPGDLEFVFVYGDASKPADETRILFDMAQQKQKFGGN